MEEFCIHVWVFLPQLNKVVLETLEEEEREEEEDEEAGVSLDIEQLPGAVNIILLPLGVAQCYVTLAIPTITLVS